MKKEVVSIYVDNKANVLTRVVSLYGRRGFNIDSLTVSATNDPDISRITVTFEGDNLTLHQIVSQTEKLEVVRSVKTLDGKRSFFRELLMVQIVFFALNRILMVTLFVKWVLSATIQIH